MSRRDTIIVAVLINTGLLAVLFMMAIHTDIEDPVPQNSYPREIAEVERNPKEQQIVKKAAEPPASHDEIDHMLNNYALTTTPPLYVNRDDVKRIEQPAFSQTKVTPPVETVEHYVEVTVKRGDYLEKIARANGTSVDAIMQANQLHSPRIDIGQVLKIPIDRQKSVPAKAPVPSTRELASNEPQYYTLKSGDNPWKVAKLFHVGFGELLKLNDLDEEKARNLKPGDVLRVK